LFSKNYYYGINFFPGVTAVVVRLLLLSTSLLSSSSSPPHLHQWSAAKVFSQQRPKVWTGVPGC